MRAIGISWVDLFIAILVVCGIVRGRKRGMSEELLDLIKWPMILVLAAILYKPGGEFLSRVSIFSLLASYLFVYLGIVAIIFGIFAYIRARVGGKLTGSDTFGGAEYYLGMFAGAFRYVCVILVVMALLNARLYTPAELRDNAAYQQDNYGSHFFFTLSDIQQEVFKESVTGKTVRKFAPVVLIQSTPPSTKDLRNSRTAVRARESQLKEVLDGK